MKNEMSIYSFTYVLCAYVTYADVRTGQVYGQPSRSRERGACRLVAVCRAPESVSNRL